MTNTSITRGGGNTSQACAACKYQRRKCAPDCILAPYFPHHRQSQFLNAHKLFGVSNITKLIKNLDPPQKDEAMRTIIFQSDVRANDPVGGCFRLIRQLQHQIDYNRAELDIVLHQLAMYRAQQAHQQQQSHAVQLLSAHHDSAVVDSTNLNDGYDQQYHVVQCCYGGDQYPVNDIASWVMQDHHHHHQKGSDNYVDDDGGECAVDFKSLQLDVNEEGGERSNELSFEAADDFIERSEEGVEKDEKSLLREENDSFIQHVEEDLKSAATFFSLTNSNC